MQHTVAQLRAFLRFCYDHDQITLRLDQSIGTPRTYRDELPPRALAWRTVQSLLASIDRTHKSGWRDYCILHLIAHYGLRPSEVVSLRLDLIDWERAILCVKQQKTRSALSLPLAASTIRVLHQYLAVERDRRGWTHPEVFLRVRCPDGPLVSATVSSIFKKHMLAAKLGIASGVYSLRHAFAMRLLARGVGVKLIGDSLGHRNLDTTCTYLSLDVGALRGVALDVPRSSPVREAAMPIRNPLATWDAAVAAYLANRHALGRKYEKEEYTLNLVRRFLAKQGATDPTSNSSLAGEHPLLNSVIARASSGNVPFITSAAFDAARIRTVSYQTRTGSRASSRCHFHGLSSVTRLSNSYAMPPR